MAAETGTRSVVEDYIQYRKHRQRNGRRWSYHDDNNFTNGRAEDQFDGPEIPSGELARVVRILTSEFEQRYEEVFRQSCGQIFMTPETAQSVFAAAIGSLFIDGINWGRIVAMLSFGGAVAAECVDKEMPYLVDQVIDWVTTYTDQRLISWIQQNGGWDGLVTFHRNRTVSDEPGSGAWPSFRTLCGCAVGALSVLTLGALLAQK